MNAEKAILDVIEYQDFQINHSRQTQIKRLKDYPNPKKGRETNERKP